MSYTPTYKRPYEQWKELPSKETLCTAEVLTQYDDTFENIEEYLATLNFDGEYALLTEAGYSLALSIDSNYVMTISLKNKAGEVLDSKHIDFPIESMVVNATYKNGVVTFTLQNGNVLDVDISDLVRGLVPTSRKIAGVDLEDDITAEELKTALGVFDNTVTAGELKPWLNSLEEIQAGVWLNGKPLYQKTIVAEITTSGETYVNHNIENVDFIMVAKASFLSVYNGATLNWTLGSYDNRNTIMFARKNDISVQISETGVLIPCTVYATLQYTKTTDLEGSGNSLNPYGIYDAKLDDVKSSIASVSDEVDAVEEKLRDKVLPQYKGYMFPATGWYRVAKIKNDSPCIMELQVLRTFANTPPEAHSICIVFGINSQMTFANEISYSQEMIHPKIRYTKDANFVGYIELYCDYKTDGNNTVITLSNQRNSFNGVWELIDMEATEETVEGVTVLGEHEFSANKSYESEIATVQSDIDAINSRLAYKDISSSIDVGETGCTALGYVENGQVCINIRVPQGSSSNILSQIHVATNYAPRNTTGGYLTIIGTGSDIGKLSGTIMADGAVSIFVTNALDASEIISFTYPLKSS